MKLQKSTWLAFILLIIVGAVSRLITFGVAGLAPQVAMAIFGGSVIKDKKWAFGLPILSLLLSDVMMQLLFEAGAVDRQGFYQGQWATYLCFALITLFGFLMKKINFKNILLFSVSGSVLFFIFSNFFVWLGGGGFGRPHTFNGMLLCYADALAYYRDYGLFKGLFGSEVVGGIVGFLNLILGNLIWSVVLFGGYYLLNKLSFSSSAKGVPQKA